MLSTLRPSRADRAFIICRKCRRRRGVRCLALLAGGEVEEVGADGEMAVTGRKAGEVPERRDARAATPQTVRYPIFPAVKLVFLIL